MDSDQPKEKKRPRTPTYDKPPDTSNVDLHEVINRIRHHVLVNRLRVSVLKTEFWKFKIQSKGHWSTNKRNKEGVCLIHDIVVYVIWLGE